MDNNGSLSGTDKKPDTPREARKLDEKKFLFAWVGCLAAAVILIAVFSNFVLGKKLFKAEMAEHWPGAPRQAVEAAEPAASPAARLEQTFNRIAKSMNKVTVSVTGYGFRNGAQCQIVGSGVFVAPQYVLSNLHVVQNAQSLGVTVYDPQKASYPAVITCTDPANDLAILKIQTAMNFPVASLGNSDVVDAGDIVFSIGNPLGFGNTMTSGIISDRNQTFSTGDGTTYRDMFQTSTDINEGSSGGPLANISGQVIGINTAVYAPNGNSTGIGFAMPINRALDLIQQAGLQVVRNKAVVPAAFACPPNYKLVAGGASGMQIPAQGGTAAAGVAAPRCPTCNALLYVRCRGCMRRMAQNSSGAPWVCPVGGAACPGATQACPYCSSQRVLGNNSPFVKAAG